MATLVGIVSVVVNVAGSFMTDGNWKTAGTGLTQFYWERANRRRYVSRRATQPGGGRSPLRFTWTAVTLTR